MQTPLSELETHITFEWKRAADLPFGVTEYPQAVAINGKIYIGGRIASIRSNYDAMQKVLVYDSHLNEWSMLPSCERIYFAMAAVNNELVIIGGCDADECEMIARLCVWDGKWTRTFAPMPTARCSASATTYIKWLVVIGGRTLDVSVKLSNIEILDTVSGQWYCCAPLPQPSSSISLTAAVGNMCYALGGYTTRHEESKKVWSVCLDDLISQAVSQPASHGIRIRTCTSAPPTPSPWQALQDTPLIFSTAIILDGTLFAVGGEQSYQSGGRVSLYLYQPSREGWVQLRGVLPRERERCVCVALTDRKILVAGGGGLHSREVDIAEIKRHHYAPVP